MKHASLCSIILCFLFLSASGLGQSTADESQGMPALVAEVRQLREDLQTSSGYALKAQVLLYRPQAQQAAVARASKHLNDARASLAKTQERRRAVGSSLKRNQEPIDNAETAEISPMDRKQVQGESSRLKEELENLAAEEQLRTEQAKLGGLEDRVDRLEQVSDNPHETQMLAAIQ